MAQRMLSSRSDFAYRAVPFPVLTLAAKGRRTGKPLLRLFIELGLWNPDVAALLAGTFFGVDPYDSDCHRLQSDDKSRLYQKPQTRTDAAKGRAKWKRTRSH
jgi:hypothetical protein